MPPNYDYESKLISMGFKLICGVDESGCGSLAGPVVMSCVIFPENIDYKKLLPGINDSKQISRSKREFLYPLIKEYAVSWSSAEASVNEIDRLNIYWAKWIAARRAIDKLKVLPDYILMDGDKKIPEINILQEPIIKGDAKSISISAASIIAKCDRDTIIDSLSNNVSKEYEWKINKGYYSLAHIAAIKKFGKTEWHRKKYVEKFLE